MDDGLGDGLPDDAHIEPEAPVLHVPDVVVDAAFHLPQLLGLAAEARHLCPARDAGFAEEAYHVVVDELVVHRGVHEHVRARADDAHVALEDVEELGQLVDVGAAHQVAERELAGVVLRGLQRVGILIDVHGAELVAIKLLSVHARALLEEEDGAGRLLLDDDADDECDGDEKQAHDAGEDDVERALPEAVAQLEQRAGVVGVDKIVGKLDGAQWYFADAKCRWDVVEVDEPLVAERDDAVDGLGLGGWQAAEQLVDTALRAVVCYFLIHF